MPSAPVAHPDIDRRLFECRVRFHARLRGAELVSAEAVDPALPPPRAAVPTPPASPPPSPQQPPATTTDAQAAETRRELLADRQRIESVLTQIRAASAEERKNQDARLKDWQRAAVELAMTIATRLVHDRITSGEFPMEAKVRDMIAQLGNEPVVTVRLNPADLTLLKARLGGAPLTRDKDDPRFVTDETLSRGECRVEGAESMLLSDMTRELQEIRDELLRSLGHARS